LEAVGRSLHARKTPLGIDAVAGRTIVGADLSEQQILELLDRCRDCKLVLSPIGAQGFVLAAVTSN